jgi:hypothetical protein
MGDLRETGPIGGPFKADQQCPNPIACETAEWCLGQCHEPARLNREKEEIIERITGRIRQRFSNLTLDELKEFEQQVTGKTP